MKPQFVWFKITFDNSKWSLIYNENRNQAQTITQQNEKINIMYKNT
jgi:hypothetical protein